MNRVTVLSVIVAKCSLPFIVYRRKNLLNWLNNKRLVCSWILRWHRKIHSKIHSAYKTFRSNLLFKKVNPSNPCRHGKRMLDAFLHCFHWNTEAHCNVVRTTLQYGEAPFHAQYETDQS